MARIDATARIADGARLADDVEVGPFCVVGPGAELRQGVRLVSHVCIDGQTIVGERTVVHPFAVIGSAPQSTGYKDEPTQLKIGADCIIRESVTMCTGTVEGGGITVVGDRGFFMAYVHIAHDCRVGDDVIFANNASLAGHSVIGNHVFIGGLSATHQFTHIGDHAMIAGYSGVRADVVPFALVGGTFARLTGINVIGMRRRKFSNETIRTVRNAYRMIFLGKETMAERLAAAEAAHDGDPAVMQMINFARSKRSDRPLCQPGKHTEEE